MAHEADLTSRASVLFHHIVSIWSISSLLKTLIRAAPDNFGVRRQSLATTALSLWTPKMPLNVLLSPPIQSGVALRLPPRSKSAATEVKTWQTL